MQVSLNITVIFLWWMLLNRLLDNQVTCNGLPNHHVCGWWHIKSVATLYFHFSVPITISLPLFPSVIQVLTIVMISGCSLFTRYLFLSYDFLCIFFVDFLHISWCKHLNYSSNMPSFSSLWQLTFLPFFSHGIKRHVREMLSS